MTHQNFYESAFFHHRKFLFWRFFRRFSLKFLSNSIKKSLKRSNHQRYKTSVVFADFIIGAFVLPIALVQRYHAAKLQLGSSIIRKRKYNGRDKVR